MNRAGRIWSTLAGAVIAAAFLGPGTITTAARSGAAHGLDLLWTLLLATLACFVLQDAVARLTLGSGMALGAALRRRHGGVAALLLGGAVILGCAAYEAGNIVGGVAGAGLVLEVGPAWLTLVSVVAAGILLWAGGTGAVVPVLSALVATMGVAFLVTAVGVAPRLADLVHGLFVPSAPEGSLLLVLGLVGTTVVPYNLFLGSGLAGEAEDDERFVGVSTGVSTAATIRFGLAVAIGVGGLVSMAVLVVGSAVAGDFGFEALAAVLGDRLGAWAVDLFGWGLFAAGFTSAVTAPLAAALTARGLFAGSLSAEELRGTPWADDGRAFRATWIGVLAVGAVFGLAGIRPIPVILLAQAANGLVLPLVAVFLWRVTASRELLGREAHGPLGRLVLGVVVLLAVALGLRGVWSAVGTVLALVN